MISDAKLMTTETYVPNWNESSQSAQRNLAQVWLAAFNAALENKQFESAAAMIQSHGYWRDLLTFSWDFRTMHGFAEIRAWLSDTFAACPAHGFCLEGEPYLGALGENKPTLEFFFTFETNIALGRGHVRLVDVSGSGQPQALTVLTTMKALKAFPERTGRNRPREALGIAAGDTDDRLDNRNVARGFIEKDPDVLIIGAGQSGLMLAARLGQLNIGTLVVEKLNGVGDVWRKRYRALKLHNDLSMNHFPYLPFPDTWPAYLPKDKVADWLEIYAKAMDLNVWTKTTFVKGEFDAVERRWATELRLADGSTRLMRPRHVVMAVGVSGLPSVPDLPGKHDFAGVIVHSSRPLDEIEVKGKRALIVGAGTSAHDIAQDLHLRGADVTMLQRSSITVVSLEPSAVRAYELYRENDGVLPIEDTDTMTAAVPYSLLAQLHGPLSRSMQEADKELLDGLRKVGFLLDNGEDDTGFFMKLLRYQAGYYLNIGASDLIVSGKIKLKTGTSIERLTERQVVFKDGTVTDVDILVLATGYEPLQEQVRAMFGNDVADRVGPIWGIGEDGEARNMYAPTAQENFYVAGGGFPAARYYSQYTALYIKADLEGLLPACRSQTASTNG